MPPTVAAAAVNEIAAQVEVEAGTEAAQVALVIAKRQAPEIPADNGCTIFRYGSFSTDLQIVRKSFPAVMHVCGPRLKLCEHNASRQCKDNLKSDISDDHRAVAT